MSGSTCVVSDDDYNTYWHRLHGVEAPPLPAWDGVERRLLADRRAATHERRWEKTRGRRFRLADRRVR